MSGVTQSRLRELDQVLDTAGSDAGTGEQLFAIVDALSTTSAVRRALSDPAAGGSAKAALVRSLFGDKVSPAALQVLTAAVGLHWKSGRALVDAVERQGVRAVLQGAEASGQLDEVSDELFRFGRIVAGDDALRDALNGPLLDLDTKRGLVQRLLAGKTNDLTSGLAQRALSGRGGNPEETLAGYGVVASELRDRSIAKVTAAAPLPADQLDRLRAALTRLVGRELDIQLSVDPQVMGGLRVQVGDEIIDGTVAARLDQARRQIA